MVKGEHDIMPTIIIYIDSNLQSTGHFVFFKLRFVQFLEGLILMTCIIFLLNHLYFH